MLYEATGPAAGRRCHSSRRGGDSGVDRWLCGWIWSGISGGPSRALARLRSDADRMWPPALEGVISLMKGQPLQGRFRNPGLSPCFSGRSLRPHLRSLLDGVAWEVADPEAMLRRPYFRLLFSCANNEMHDGRCLPREVSVLP